MRRIGPGLLLLGFLIFAAPVMAADAMVVDGVAQKLICQCGCTMVLNNCTHGECGSRETMMGIIRQKLDQGQTGDTIVQSFVSQYGEKVLAEPPKRGFNLTAWLAPFVGLALGAVVIYVALKRWLRRGESLAVPASAEEEDSAYMARMERELKEFPERGFR